jgi:hypothetical protein
MMVGGNDHHSQSRRDGWPSLAPLVGQSHPDGQHLNAMKRHEDWHKEIGRNALGLIVMFALASLLVGQSASSQSALPSNMLISIGIGTSNSNLACNPTMPVEAIRQCEDELGASIAPEHSMMDGGCVVEVQGNTVSVEDDVARCMRLARLDYAEGLPAR